MADPLAKVEVRGLARFERLLAELPAQLRARMAAVSEANAREFAEKLKVVTPTDEDHDDVHIVDTIAVYPDRTWPGAWRVSIGDAKAPYAAHLEFGHMDGATHVPANAFFFPLYREMKRTFRARYRAEFKAAMKAADAAAGPSEAA